MGFPSGGSPHGGDPHLHEQVQLAQVIVTAGGRVSAHHVLAVDVGVGEHVLAGGQAQAVLGGGQAEAEDARVVADLDLLDQGQLDAVPRLECDRGLRVVHVF